MLKVMTIVGTRPELIKMSRVIDIFDKYTKHVLVHTGQNYDYELNQIFFKELGIRKPDYFLESAKENAALTIASVIEKSDKVFDREKPDALLLYGDTNSCLAVISAKRRKIPIFHMEAGNRCFDQRVPEEINRKIVDHLSDVNMVLTEHARRYLIDEGIKPEVIFKTGSHMKEVLNFFKPKISKSTVLKKLSLKPKKFFIVSAHREENIDNDLNFKDFLASLEAIYHKFKLPIIVSTHPRTQKRLNAFKSIKFNKNIQFAKPFGFFDYIKLQQEAFCVISDSGTISEEASLLNLPAITIRNAHERPEAIDSGIFIMSGLKKEKVLDAIHVATNLHKNDLKKESVEDYESNNVSEKILKIVMGYENYINRTVWSK
jgi:UDP-N-acetylglucosamine 2-epimerase (non-hydrolysing)